MPSLAIVEAPHCTRAKAGSSAVHAQGYLAHKKHPPPRNLQWDYLWSYGSPRGGGWLFLVREVPLYQHPRHHAAPIESPHPPSVHQIQGSLDSKDTHRPGSEDPRPHDLCMCAHILSFLYFPEGTYGSSPPLQSRLLEPLLLISCGLLEWLLYPTLPTLGPYGRSICLGA
jgi:hypothetical protein